MSNMSLSKKRDIHPQTVEHQREKEQMISERDLLSSKNDYHPKLRKHMRSNQDLPSMPIIDLDDSKSNDGAEVVANRDCHKVDDHEFELISSGENENHEERMEVTIPSVTKISSPKWESLGWSSFRQSEAPMFSKTIVNSAMAKNR